MAYTINANAKNVWIRDNEDTRDLSIQTDASSVYLDNGRTLEQELGEGSMVSNVATVDNSMSKVIDGTLDGVYESGVMYGRSLVNILNTPTVTVTFNNGWRGLSPNRTLETNKKYLAIYHVETNTLDGTIKDVFRYGDDQTLWGVSVVPIGGVGVFKRTFTTPHEIIHYNCYTDNSTTGSANVRCVLLEYQEGMENWNIPFFEGICDVKMPILHNVGKNLFDGILESGRINVTTGENQTNSNMVRSRNFVEVKPSTTYTLSYEIDNGLINVAFYGSNKEFLGINLTESSQVVGGSLGSYKKILTTNNTHYLRFYSNSALTITDTSFKSQLEESPTPTPYEDYKTNILRTSEEIVLREVNGVQDTYNPLTGEYIQRIGEVVFDGSDDENWELFEDNYSRQPNTTLFRINLNNIHITNSPCICSDFIDKNTYQIDEESVFFATGFRIRLNKTKLEADNVSALKAFLQSNPIKVQYQLATPITTIVEPLTIPFTYQNGHVILESGFEGQSLLPTLEYSTVVNRTGQVESVAKTIQTQEKQLTMLEQMLIQNIIELDYNNTVLALNLEINEVM